MMAANIDSAAVSLRTSLNPVSLLGPQEGLEIIALGSFHQRKGELPLFSRLAKLVKTSARDWVELLAQECLHRSYADLIAESASRFQPGALVRVLASGETTHQSNLPMARLADAVCQRLQIPNETGIFTKTYPRPPLRFLPNLSGEAALEDRIRSVLRFLQLFPSKLPDRVMLLDDIYALGASARVYAAALRRYCSVKQVYSINIAAIRFAGGQDAWKHPSSHSALKELASRALELAREAWQNHPRHSEAPQLLERVWIEKPVSVLHYAAGCCPGAAETLWFLAHREGGNCPRCAPSPHKHRLWHRLLGGDK
jgi:predicted amidophosphoribosyltransferase